MKENKKYIEKSLDNADAIEKKIAQMKLNFSSIQEQEKSLQAEADKLSLLVSTDDDLMSRYRRNLEAFKEYHPEIYDFFKDFEPQSFIVDAPDGFVNAINVETGQYLYQYPSYLLTKLQFDEFKRSPNIKKFNFNSEDDNEAKFMHVDSVDAMIALLPEKKSTIKNQPKLPANDLSSLIIFGVGAGYHIELFAQQYDISCLYIVEPDLDLFFLSLFSINWQFVLTTLDSKGCLVHISLGEQKDTFFDDLMKQSAINGRFQMAHVAGYIHYQSPQLSELLTVFNRRYLEMGQGWGFFDDAVMAIGHTLENIHNKVPMLKKIAINNDDLTQVPVFIVGNGPSLDTLIDTIKRYQGKAIIISCGTGLSALYKYGIKPDFHCEQERTFPIAEQIEHYCPSTFLDDLVLLAPTTVHPAVFSKFKKSIMAPKANEPSTVLLLKDKELGDLFSAYHFINPTVANTALVMGYNLGFRNFYLFGIDLGYKAGGNHHSKKSLYYSEDEQDIELYQTNNETDIEMEGNFGGKFISDRFFYQSNQNLSKQVLTYKDINCFNLSDGTAITGCTPMTKDNFDLLFNEQPELDKKASMNKLLDQSFYTDDGTLLSRLVSNLDYQYFDDVCQRLITLNINPVATFKEAKTLLLNNTIVLNALTEHVHSLLQGTIMHMQVVLVQLLYASPDEISAVKAFNKGMIHYCEFIEKAVKYYRENAEKAHYIENSKFIVKLRNK